MLHDPNSSAILDRGRLAVTTEPQARLGRGNGRRLPECLCEPGEDAEVGVDPDAGEAARAKRGESVSCFQASELPLIVRGVNLREKLRERRQRKARKRYEREVARGTDGRKRDREDCWRWQNGRCLP
jgi:hypothetical protein